MKGELWYLCKKAVAGMLAFAVCFTGMQMPSADSMEVKAAETPISILSEDDLKKIGNSEQYPMDGDYVLGADIQLSGENWTPIGGAVGDYKETSGSRVFSGTLDGQGHTIDGLTIQYNGVNSGGFNASGLFAIVASEKAGDYAEIKNINFTGVSITHTLGKGDTIGALTGGVSGYAKIENVAVLDGSITVNAGDGNGDLIGVGGLIGQTRMYAENVQLKSLYNAADVTVLQDSFTYPTRCGGIIGRIHPGDGGNSQIGALTSCVNTGKITFKGSKGYAINGCSSNEPNQAVDTKNITNCFYLAGSGMDYADSMSVSKTEAELASQEVLKALGDQWMVKNGSLCLKISESALAASIPLPEFAEGDSASSVTQNFKVPLAYTTENGEEAITWKSSEESVISIDGKTGVATVSPVYVSTKVTLTAETASGRKRIITVTVVSDSEMALSLDQKYATPGKSIVASVVNAPKDLKISYVWTVDGKRVSDTDTYTPQSTDLEKMMIVTATANGMQIGSKEMYVSKLPVVYINTDDGNQITDKENYKDATMRIQGNDKYNDDSLNANGVDLYDGAIEIRGRGNSTWNLSYSKLPYKIKLKDKTNLLGFGSSKHWVLLANYMDESLLRNTLSYDLSGEMGMRYLPSAHVDVILNGRYAGNYQLLGNVRVDKNRVNVYDWEGLAGDVAEAIADKETASGNKIKAGDLEDYLNENMQWITSDSVAYNGKNYRISDYYKSIPKTADGKVDVSGGFLFELDEYFDEVSKFYTDYELPIMVKSPEFLRPTIGRTDQEDTGKERCDALYAYAREYMQAVEDSVHADDFYADVQKTGGDKNAASFTEDYEGRRHYTELVDLDSLVRYLILNEFFWNTETMKKSSYMYKDRGKKLFIGPVWDMDWTSNSMVSESETSNYSVWMIKSTSDRSDIQKNSWYLSLIKDPYFVQKMLECYTENRQNFNDIVKENGLIDQNVAYLRESANVNYSNGFLRYDCNMDFESATNRLKTFLVNRLGWMDAQFKDLSTLLKSLGAYQGSSQISVTAGGFDKGETTTTYTAEVADKNAVKIAFYVNGIQEGIVDVADQKAVFVSQDAHLERRKGAKNVVQVRAMDASGNLLSNVNSYAVFEKELPVEKLSCTVTIKEAVRAHVGSVLTAEVTDSNHTGELSYQWKADGKAISGATYATYIVTEKEKGKTITVEVSSSIEEGTVESAATGAILEEMQNDHLLIHQVFGGGANDGASISHSFIELYNPTDAAVSLKGYKIGYYSGRKDAPGYTENEVYLELDETKEIPPQHSYLIRCEAQDPYDFTLKVDAFDQEWTVSSMTEPEPTTPTEPEPTTPTEPEPTTPTEPTEPEASMASAEPVIQVIANKRYKVVLYNGETYVDGVSVNETPTEGAPLADDPVKGEILSKNKTVRRKNFADTDNNVADFDVVNYKPDKMTPEKLELNRPRTLADGAWSNPTEPEELSGTVSIRGNAIVGAILYVDTGNVANNTGDLSYEWQADQKKITGAIGEFLELTEDYTGKEISVTVRSSVEGGSLSASLSGKVSVVEAQRKHLLVHQVYGDGGKKDVPISHSFIELYNPTAEEVDLSSYAIVYRDTSEAEAVQEKLTLSGTVPARASYLIRCAAATANKDAITIDEFDQSWESRTINNKQYSIVLENDGAYVDGVSVNEKPVEGDLALTDPEGDTIISKNKAVRRIGFIDTDNNVQDFEVLNYSKLPKELIEKVTARSAKDGSWGLNAETDPDKPGPEEPDPDKPGPEEPDPDKPGPEEPDPDKPGPEEPDPDKPGPGNPTPEDPTPEDPTPEDPTPEDPGTQIPITNPDNNQTGQGGDTTLPSIPAAGETFTFGTGWYEITKSEAGGGTVTFMKPVKKTYTKITIPDKVDYKGIAYQVTAIRAGAFKNNKKLKKVTIGANVGEIGASAFAGCKKLKSIVIRSTVLKKVGKKALKGIHAKCKIKAPKKKLGAYRKIFKKKGQKSGVKVVK